jgi:2-polyprenyl-3-methyl-5-hydroxy-6-metoxy-1,4-benzoquinol methylase
MDPTTSFRVYSRRAAEILSREVLGFNGFSFFGAGIAVLAAHGLLVNETPIHFRPRVGGQSNLSARQTVRAVRDLPRIRAHSSMVRRRERAFKSLTTNPLEYTASRELEQLSNTPVSTRIIIDLLDRHIGRNVLEIGAGLGLVTESLLGRGRNVTALEPDPRLFARLVSNPGAAGAELSNSTLSSWSERAQLVGTFDTVLYVNVLEHIDDDVGELQVAAEMCAPGGTVVVFVPAAPSLYGTMDWMSGHYRRYRAEELRAVAGFGCLETVGCSYFDVVGKMPYWLMYRVLRRRTLGGGAVGMYDKVIIPLSSAVPPIVSRFFGGKNLVLVARVPPAET